MRIMQTSVCERNCYYCPFQAGRDYRRVSLTPEELAEAFDQMQRKKLVDGLFLSSGVVGVFYSVLLNRHASDPDYSSEIIDMLQCIGELPFDHE